MSTITRRPTRYQSIKATLELYAPADLAARYQEGMEALMQVDPEKGEPVYKDHKTPIPNTYDDGKFVHFTIRIQSPGDGAKPQTFPPEDYFEAIGISGLDVERNVAYAVGYDFDSILNHDEARGLTEQQLADLLAALKKLPYVEIRRSTSGNGYHVWVWFPVTDLPQVHNRIEMRALARAVLQRMSLDTGYRFEGDVDHLGDILWICARRATAENGGLSLVQAAASPLEDWPRDFLDHVDVITRKRRRTRLRGANVADADAIDAATNDRPRDCLEPKHREFLKCYAKSGYAGYWNEDHNCFVCHTQGIAETLKQVQLPGLFETSSNGNDPDKPNCWMYPLSDAAWRAFRFSHGTDEAPTWELSRNGWRTCVIGRTPSLSQLAAKFNGKKTSKGVAFLSAEDATNALLQLGASIDLPTWFERRPITIKQVPRGLEADFPYEEGDAGGDNGLTANERGWFRPPRSTAWRKFIEIEVELSHPDYHSLADDVVRSVCHQGEHIGLFTHTEAGWNQQILSMVKPRMSHEGITGGLQNDVLGWCDKYPYLRTARPFQPEYPGNREWNKDGTKLLFLPAIADGETPMWDKILAHLGRGLDEALDPWCQEHGIEMGADYLRYWIANLIRFPERRLPMLAVYSPENKTGKSLLHEAPAILFDEKGYIFATKAIKNKSGFDGELHGKVLCALEEINLTESADFYANLKKLITSHRADFTFKKENTFMDTNFTHWIMTTNHREYIPIELHDERIILWEVTPFEGDEIPKPQLLDMLRKEAPQFLRKLFALDLSDIAGRVTLPVLMTSEKAAAMFNKQADFPGLEGLALKAAEAIQKLSKPWGPGSATMLNAALGNWDGNAGKVPDKSRINSLGRYLAKIVPHLKKQDVKLEIKDGKTSQYTISA